jgi:hypothetical protein
MSRIFALRARLIEIGISKMVMMVDMRKVENIIIVQGSRFRGSRVQGSKSQSSRFRVQRFRGSKFHSRPWTALGMRIYEKSVNFVRPNPKFVAKLAIIWENEHC